MKKGIHPEYEPATIVCSCGNEIETRSTQEDIHIEICSVCHPFYTGRQKLVDTAGRVERFQRKYGDTSLSESEVEEAPEVQEAPEGRDDEAEEGEEEDRAPTAAAEPSEEEAGAETSEPEASGETEAETAESEEKAEA